MPSSPAVTVMLLLAKYIFPTVISSSLSTLTPSSLASMVIVVPVMLSSSLTLKASPTDVMLKVPPVIWRVSFALMALLFLPSTLRVPEPLMVKSTLEKRAAFAFSSLLELESERLLVVPSARVR